jgi:hypothetical protein
LIDRRTTHVKLARALVPGVTLAAMNLAGAVAQAQSNDEATSQQDARRPPTQAQVGEAWRQSRLPAWRHPTGAPVPPAEPSSPSGWLLASLGGLVAALALIAGLAVLATRRAGRRVRAGHAA